MLRITGGTHKGRYLSPVDSTVRPTMERVRTAFFTRVERLISLEGITVLDLFGGSGIMGLEALSRGAASVTVCEKSRTVFRCIEQCYQNHPSRPNSYQLYNMAAERFVDRNSSPFNLIIIDPPYRYQHYQNLIERAHRSLSQSRSMFAVFHQTTRSLHTRCPVLATNRYGDTTVTLLDGSGAPSIYKG